MKKFFTLIAATLFAVSMNAKTDLDFSGIYTSGTTIDFTGGWQWKGVTLASGFDEEKDGDTWVSFGDANATYFDASAYDYLCLKYSASTCDVNLIIQYNYKGTIGQWGPEFEQGQVSMIKSAKGGFVAIKLDADKKAKVNQVAVQNLNDAGSLTVEEIFWGSTAEYEAYMSDQPVVTTQDIDYTTFGSYDASAGAFVLAAGGAGWHSKWFGTFDVTDWNSLVIEVESTNGDVQLVVQGDHADGAPENMMILASETPQKYIMDISGWTNISQMAFQNFNFPDPDIEDWATKEATAQETTMKVTAMYISKDAAPAEELTLNRIAWTEDMIGDAAAEYKAGDFLLSIVDTDGKVKVDANNAYFGTADNYEKFTHRLKSGGKSSSKNSMTLTIPADGTLKVYARTGSNSAEDRTVVISQNEEELYNQVVKEADAVAVRINPDDEKDTNVYPVISVPVKAGTVLVGYPVGSINFYAFDLLTAGGSSSVESVVVKPAKTNDAIYNLRGQRVDASYKGIVIRNGKKYLVK